MSLVLIAIAIHTFEPLVLHAAIPIAAGATLAAGFLVMIRAWWLFRQADTAICPTAETTTLVTSDIYAVTRNPMYLGMALMLLSAGLYTGALPFYVATVLFAAVINRHFIPYEEAKLRQKFGETFNEYSRRVRRWI
jgi:protein-S-isoprenylcysteine O-methyltransferase Ste14